MDIVMLAVFVGVAFSLAFFVEASTEYFFGTPFDKIPKLKEYKWVLMYVSALIGVGLSLYWKIDLIAATALFIEKMFNYDQFIWNVSPVGMVVSGITIGRGSNYLHEWLKKTLKKPDVLVDVAPQPIVTTMEKTE